jgi:hypothetical protein
MIKNQALIDHPGNRVGDSQDLTTRPRSITYREKQGANCAGLLQGSNCGGDPFWTMPDGNWWSWPGIGGSPTNLARGTIIQGSVQNPSGYDFVGGQTTQGQAITTLNERIYGGYGLVESRGHQDVYERVWYNCNCGIGSSNQQVNCYSNCNCNCNCNCACCNCGTCFPAETQITMADGTLRRIVDVGIGERVLSELGRIGRVAGLYRVKLGDRILFEINGRLRTTGDHLLLTETGWGAILPRLYAERRFGRSFPVTVDEHGTVLPVLNATIPPDRIVEIDVGSRLIGGDGGFVEIGPILPVQGVSPDLDLFCLVIANTGDFAAQGFVAEGLVVDGFIRG